MSTIADQDALRAGWLGRLSKLIADVRTWATEFGWSTRQIEVSLTDSQLGKYSAPALLLQEQASKILLEPIARSAPGAQGVVDIYLMPAYDDIASLYLHDDGWHIHYMFPNSPTVGNIRDAESKPLTPDSLREVLEAIKLNAVS